jgi:hypothetical protein
VRPPGAAIEVKPCGCCATLTPLIVVARGGVIARATNPLPRLNRAAQGVKPSKIRDVPGTCESPSKPWFSKIKILDVLSLDILKDLSGKL